MNNCKDSDQVIHHLKIKCGLPTISLLNSRGNILSGWAEYIFKSVFIRPGWTFYEGNVEFLAQQYRFCMPGTMKLNLVSVLTIKDYKS
jgi:hypothetical protein